MHWYRDVEEAEANQKTVALARDAAHKAAKELGVSLAGLLWFTDAAPSAPGAYSRVFPMKGECRGLQKRIWLHVALTGDDLVNTCGHECRHAWQFHNGMLHPLAKANSFEVYAQAEADAAQFARKFTARYTGRPSGIDETANALLQDLHAAVATL